MFFYITLRFIFIPLKFNPPESINDIHPSVIFLCLFVCLFISFKTSKFYKNLYLFNIFTTIINNSIISLTQDLRYCPSNWLVRDVLMCYYYDQISSEYTPYKKKCAICVSSITITNLKTTIHNFPLSPCPLVPLSPLPSYSGKLANISSTTRFALLSNKFHSTSPVSSSKLVSISTVSSLRVYSTKHT